MRLVSGGEVAMVALSASAASSDEKALGEIAEEIGSVCRDRSVGLGLPLLREGDHLPMKSDP